MPVDAVLGVRLDDPCRSAVAVVTTTTDGSDPVAAWPGAGAVLGGRVGLGVELGGVLGLAVVAGLDDGRMVGLGSVGLVVGAVVAGRVVGVVVGVVARVVDGVVTVVIVGVVVVGAVVPGDPLAAVP